MGYPVHDHVIRVLESVSRQWRENIREPKGIESDSQLFDTVLVAFEAFSLTDRGTTVGFTR